MTPRKIHGHFHAWFRNCLLIVATMMMCIHVAAQVDVGGKNHQTLLTPWMTLNGAWVTAPLNPHSAQPQGPLQTGFLTWQLPVAVAASSHLVYVADAGHRRIFRYDQMLQSISAFTNFVVGLDTAIAVAHDLSLYVIDRNTRQVLHFSMDGRLIQKFGNNSEMASPVAVLLDEFRGRVLVADRLYNHVVVFNSLGRVLQVFKPSHAQSIVAMAQGPDGLYLLDPLSRQVVVIGHDGTDRYTLGKGILKMPGAIAVDRFNRVFVSDSFDNSIKIFEMGKQVASVGTNGNVLASFNRITNLFMDQNTLYVADSLNRRIQTFRVDTTAPVRGLEQ